MRQLHDQKMESDQRRKEDIASLQMAYEVNLKLFRNTVQANTEELLKQRSAELQSANTQQMEVSEALGISIFFAKPYHSWEGEQTRIPMASTGSIFQKELIFAP